MVAANVTEIDVDVRFYEWISRHIDENLNMIQFTYDARLFAL